MTDTTTTADTEPSPVVAAGAGIVFGLIVSGLFWLRSRRPGQKRSSTAARRDDALPVAALPLAGRAAEPGFSVSYTPAEDTLAAEFADDKDSGWAPPPASAPAGEDITSELEELFDSTDTTIQKRLNLEKTVAARSLAPAPADVGTAGDEEVDFLVGDATGEEATLRASTADQPRPGYDPHAPTVDQPRPNFDPHSPTVDLKTLASSATKDQQQAQTLLEALTLLERDYEEELTASQVLDTSAVRKALGDGADEPTQINEARKTGR